MKLARKAAEPILAQRTAAAGTPPRHGGVRRWRRA